MPYFSSATGRPLIACRIAFKMGHDFTARPHYRPAVDISSFKTPKDIGSADTVSLTFSVLRNRQKNEV
jgi:hypothetical protein